MFELESPISTAALRAALAALTDDISTYAATFETEAFFAPQGEHWSPAGHLRHLTKSVRPVAKAMGWPKLGLRLLFGTSGDGSRSFEAVRSQYHRALADGGQAGRFSPSSRRPGLEPEAWRAAILQRWRQAGDDLLAALDRWRDRDLDRLRLPHPLLGKLTVREMLLFTLYHNAHHARRVVERARAT